MDGEFGDLTIAEELILFLLEADTGYIVPIPEWRMSCALVGAVLLDLSFKGRIDTDLDELKVLDSTPTGSDLLDPTLAALAAESEPHEPRFWVERLAAGADEINELVFSHLVDRKIVNHDDGGFWSLSANVVRSGRYPTVDGTLGEVIRSRILRTIFDNEIPDPHDVTVVGLIRACRGFNAILPPEEFEEVEERIDLIAGLDLFGRAVLAAVESSYAPPPSMRAGRQSLPTVGTLECLRSASFRSKNLPKFFAEMAQKYGPVFELNTFGQKRIILAGAEMNHWVGRNGRSYLRCRDYLEDFQTAWGTARSIASMDGADHYRMRKACRAGNARKVVEDRLSAVYSITRDRFRGWNAGEVLPGEMTMQRWIGSQISELSISIRPTDDVLDGLLIYEFRSLIVHILKMLPKFTLKTPAMKRALNAILDVFDNIHRSHTPAQRANKRRDLVDDLMELHQSDPQFLPETDLEFSFIAPIIAGHYVGSAMNFALYELITNPDLNERIAAEADALFANGDPEAEQFNMDAIDVTHRFCMENLRLHPVIPAHHRTAANAFEVDGKLIPARSTLLVAFPAAHYMSENFKDPEKFDIDRYLPPRNEHRKRGAYQPFGVGTHTCLGSRYTELLMAVNVLMLAHHLELEMVPSNYKLKLSPLPKFSPNKQFKFRVKRFRKPLPSAM